MTPLFFVRDLTFFYPRQSVAALENVSLDVTPGEFLLLCGPSGGGKSTLLRQMKPSLTPYGTKQGDILYDGCPLTQLDQRRQAQEIGFVLQSPENQIVTDKVWHELAFGLESLGYDTPTIRRRVAEMASYFGIQEWFHKDVSELSGGQKQLLNLAGVMAMQPRVLILDEPTAQLDPIAAIDFLATLGRINRELGTTVILSEHRLEDAFALASRVAVLEQGHIRFIGEPREVGMALKGEDHAMFRAMPAAMRIWSAVPNPGEVCPITVREGRAWLADRAREMPLGALPPEKERPKTGVTTVQAEELWFRYEKDVPDVIKGMSLSVDRGELLALLGGNGAGKTTALKLLAGLLTPYRGTVTRSGSVGMLPQDPKTLFVKNNLREDLLEVLAAKEPDPAARKAKLDRVAALCGLNGLMERHPYDLSGGEQQRGALAKVLLLEPELLLLDEPTKGLDAGAKETLAQILASLCDQGVTVIMASHDLDFCAQYAHCCALVFDGSIVDQAPPRAFFSGNRFYTTPADRIAQDHLPGAVTVEDVVVACGGEVPLVQVSKNADTAPSAPPPVKIVQSPRKCSKHTLVALALLLLLVPLTLLWGEFYLDTRKYYATALLILLECMTAFFLAFEARRPQARELVVIAVLCAIGVAGRQVFFMLHECKPVIALVVVSGVALGAEAGFLVGAMTMLLSNMLFSQGPWTPWQMFAMGLIGLLSGALFHTGMLRRSRGALCVFGAIASIVVYGGIMDLQSALAWSHELNWGILLSYYAAGFPFDCIRALATWVFLWFGGELMLEKLDRVKGKFGLME